MYSLTDVLFLIVLQLVIFMKIGTCIKPLNMLYFTFEDFYSI